jgi:raffinose/stachyose/melibiose transport system permease protein
MFKNKAAYFYTLPIILFILAFCIYPILYNLFYGFFDWNSIGMPKTFAGLKNYKLAFTDSVMLTVFKNTTIYLVVTTVTRVLLGMYLAYIIKCGVPFGDLIKTVLYVPAIISFAVLGVVFGHMLDVNYGVLGDLARTFGWASIIRYPPLAYPRPALISIIAISVWKWTGYNMILYYSALMGVPDDMIEAATIDGASRPVIFFRILFPMLKSTHYTSVILCVLGALKAFDNIWTLTKGGPGYATHFFSTYIYFRSVNQGRIGYASALASLLVLLTLLLTIFQIRQYNKTLEAQGGRP